MNFDYEKLGIKVNFSEDEKEKIRAIKNDPNRLTDRDSGYPKPKRGHDLKLSIGPLSRHDQERVEFVKNHEHYLMMVRDIWQADLWKIDRYHPGYEHKLAFKED